MSGDTPRSSPAARTFGVLGFPLRQSLSPALFTWIFTREGMDARYTAWETPPEDVAAFAASFRAKARGGASVTIPHKQAIIEHLDGVTETARTIGAVNTLFWKDGALLGHNTDMEGFVAPISANQKPETVLVLGAGGGARAVLAGLSSLGVPHVILAARNRDKALRLAADFRPSFAVLECISWETREAAPATAGSSLWVVNTTPLGMRGKAEGLSPMSRESLAAVSRPERCLAYDLVYNPLETTFLTAAKDAGWQFRDGLDMFAAQAAAQFRLWTGREMPVAEARAFLMHQLAA